MKICNEAWIFFLDQKHMNSKHTIRFNKGRSHLMAIYRLMYSHKYEIADYRFRAKGEDQLVKVDAFKPDKL